MQFEYQPCTSFGRGRDADHGPTDSVKTFPFAAAALAAP